MFKTEKELILASSSPRRRQLLAGLGIDFAVVGPDVDESLREGEAAHAYVLRMAEAKGQVVADLNPAAWVVAADTVVIADGRLMMKPESEDQAVEMLSLLSGRIHQVRTAYCVCCREQREKIVQSVLTEVRFKSFDPAWGRAYARTGEPLDKAGGYGIQGRGGVLVESLSGSYTNVVGLPLAEVVALLAEHKVVVPAF
jgi:septum formation protein